MRYYYCLTILQTIYAKKSISESIIIISKDMRKKINITMKKSKISTPSIVLLILTISSYRSGEIKFDLAHYYHNSPYFQKLPE